MLTRNGGNDPQRYDPRHRVVEAAIVMHREVVDPHRKLVVEVLEELGYTAIEAALGANALEILDSESRIDLLVTDVGLPTSDQRVRNRRSLHRRRHAGNKRTAACRRSTKAEAGAERAFHDRLHPKRHCP